MPTTARINERYERRRVLGQGGMGVVWWAFDHTLNREVSLKTIRDVRDKTALDLFRKECATLASMAHPNIVEIYDIGAMVENGQEVPYFVMPLLRGLTLDKLIETAASRLSVERCVDILLQVCRGLQAAHDKGLVHRDLKPSNIFVLEDDSAKIIDFGVAHLIDVHSTVKHGGTLLYMSPEQVMLKKPTPASDLFSLGVVAFEAITRRRPFEADSKEDLAERILHEMPPPAYQVNSSVSVAISQVIHKAMAKQPYQRFASAKEFGDYLQRAAHNDPIEYFSPARIEPRIQRVRKALEQGEVEFANEIISELESEAVLHPDLASLRKSTDEAVRSKTIQQLLETARRRFEEEEYQLALQKLQEALDLDPANTEAHTLRGDIENKRSSRQIDDWLRLAREHMENHAYGHARQALQSVLQLRPKESKAQQLLSEVDQREQEYQKARTEKESVYNAALEALEKGDLSSALSRLERVLEMDRRAPDTFSPDRAAVYQKLYNKVRSEHDQLVNSYQEARKQLDNGNFAAALTICEEVLKKSPANALFQSLKFDIEDRQRQEVSAYVARVDRAVDAEADLNRKLQLLEEALEKCPEETHFQRSLHTIRSKRDLVESIVAKARAFEGKGQFGEALAQWEILRNIYRQYPGLDVECERVSRRKQHRDRSDVRGRWVQRIDQALNVGDFSRALELCREALGEYTGDAELLALQRTASQELERIAQAEGLLREAETDFAAGNKEHGLQLLRDANHLDPTSSPIRQRLLDLLIGEAKSHIDGDWQQADGYLQEAIDLDPGNALARSLKTLIQDKKHESCVTDALSRARAFQAKADLPQAIAVLDEALQQYPDDTRLTQLRTQLKRSQKDAARVASRKLDVEELRTIQREAETVFNKDELESLFVKTQALATRYRDDDEFKAVTDALRERLERSRKPAADLDTDKPEVIAKTPPPPPPPRPPRPAAAPPAPPWYTAIGPFFSKLQARVIESFRDIVRVFHGQLPMSRLAIPAVLLAAALLLMVRVLQVYLPKNQEPPSATTSVAPPPPVEGPVEPPPITVDAPVPKPAVQVVAEMERAEVSIDGVPLDSKGSGLFVFSTIPDGEHTLQITSPDGVGASIRAEFKSNSLPNVLELKGNRARVFAAATYNGAGQFFASSEGQKVGFAMDEAASEELGPSGLTRDNLGTAGSKVVSVQYGAEQPIQHQLELGQNPKLFVALTPDAPNGTLEIVAGGATDVQVFINGRPRRYVPLRGSLYMGLIPGTIQVRVERPGYYPSEEQTVQLQRDKTRKLQFDLRPIPKVGKLAIRNGAGAEVSVGEQDGHRVGSDGTLTINVNPGRHKVHIARQGFRTVTREIEFKAGDSEEIDVSKLNFEALVVSGQVTFQGSPAAAEIRLSSADGRTSPARVNTPISLRAGKYTYQITAPGYDSYTGDFELKTGDPQTISFSMKKVAEPEPAKPTVGGMSGWNNAPEWKLSPNGYYVKKGNAQSTYSTSAAGTFSFTVPCSTKRILGMGGDCKSRIFLIGSPQGDLSFDITESKIRRKEGNQGEVDRPFSSKIANEMQITVRTTKSGVTLQINGTSVDSIEGDYTNARFGISQIDRMKDFQHSAR